MKCTYKSSSNTILKGQQPSSTHVSYILEILRISVFVSVSYPCQCLCYIGFVSEKHPKRLELAVKTLGSITLAKAFFYLTFPCSFHYAQIFNGRYVHPILHSSSRQNLNALKKQGLNYLY